MIARLHIRQGVDMKIKRGLKIIEIIILIIIVLILVHTIRNTIIIIDLQNKVKKYSNSNNYHIKATTHINENTTMIINQYQKNEKQLLILERIVNDEKVKISYYNTGKQIDMFTETKDEKKYWEIYGETGNYDSKNGVAMLDNVIGNFYDDKNEVSMSFESSKGTYNEKKEQIILYEDTFIVLKDLTTLRADKLIWSGKDVPTIAEGNVRITRKSDLLATAKKVEISPNYEKFKIIGNTVSKVYSDKEIK